MPVASLVKFGRTEYYVPSKFTFEEQEKIKVLKSILKKAKTSRTKTTRYVTKCYSKKRTSIFICF